MKLVLLGLTGVGKSTIAKNLAQALGLRVLEIDDETTRLNGGVWPESEEVIDALFERIVPRVFHMDTVLFVTSWLSVEEIETFFAHGFVILELHASPKELVKRKRQRGDSLEDGRFDKNYPVYKDITRKAAAQDFFTLSLDTTGMSPEVVRRTILTALSEVDSSSRR